MWMFFALFFLLIVAIYKLLNLNYGYWKKRGVPYPPVTTLFGNLKDVVFVKKSLGQFYAELYRKYPKLPYVGFYKVRQPAILVRDVELIKNILIRDFNSFHDNDIHIDEKTDPIFGKNPFALKGERWKTSRNQLIPCFTTKKLKTMFPLIEEVGKKMVKYINETLESDCDEALEAKELSAKFTTDSVASCAFGINGYAFEDPNSEFRAIGKKLLTPSLSLALTHLSVLLVPSLQKILNVKFFPDEVTRYFRTITREMINYRETNKIVRGDFLDIMRELKAKLGEDEFGYDDITAHAGGVYADGYETSSLAMSFTLYELAVNLDVQTKLRSEIDNLLASNNGQFNYEELLENTYLESVLLESLRKNPPAYFSSKLCTKPYKLPSPFGEGKGTDVLIEPGTPVIISSYGIQRDPQHYPDPERFDPERFSSEHRNSRAKCTFLSFGDGPRMCLGMKFGISQVKIGLAHIISNFEVRLNKRTPVPIEIDPLYFMLKAKSDIWINFYKRK